MSLKALFLLMILSATVFVGVQVVPVYFNNWVFQDKMQEAAEFARQHRQSPEDLRKAILREAQNLDVPLRPEDIVAEIDSRGVLVSAHYTVTVDLQVYHPTLQFSPTFAMP